MKRFLQSLPFLRWYFGERYYRIGGRTYIQRPLVIAQIEQLTDVAKNTPRPERIDALGIVTMLGNQLAHAAAIVLTPRGMAPKDKDREALAEELRGCLDLDTALRVVDDFFTCNRLESNFGRLSEIMAKMITVKGAAVGPKSSSASSPAETSPAATPSSGDIPSESANPTSATADAS